MEVIQGKIDCQPEETGYDSSRIDVLNSKLQDLIGRQVIHGASYCISHKGKIIAHSSIGSGNAVTENVAMQPDTVFRIASITKTFTAAAIMQLVEDGKIRLDTPVGEILQPFANGPFQEITIMHLLTHTSGLYPDENCFPEGYPKQPWELINSAYDYYVKSGKEGEFDWVSAGISMGLRIPVGTQWQYCTFGFVLLGEVISRVSGMFAHEYIEKHILRPLQMKDSGFTHIPDMAKRAFVWNKEEEVRLKEIAEGKQLSQEEGIWDKIPSTGGGLNSTVYDLVRFGNAFVYNGRLDGARILGRKAVEKMGTVQLHNIPDYCWGAKEENRLYGIGFDMRQGPAYTYSKGTIMHEGAGACSLDIDPKEELVAAWFVPFHIVEWGWTAEPLYNVQNIIWSGLI